MPAGQQMGDALKEPARVQVGVLRLVGERGQLIASLAQAKGKISEIELQIIQIDEDMRAETMRDLRELQARETELARQKAAADAQLARDKADPDGCNPNRQTCRRVGLLDGAAYSAWLKKARGFGEAIWDPIKLIARIDLWYFAAAFLTLASGAPRDWASLVIASVQGNEVPPSLDLTIMRLNCWTFCRSVLVVTLETTK